MVQTGWKQYLRNQIQLHPAMEPQDVYKMMFQAAFGAEHILQEKEAAYVYLKREFEETEPSDELLYEQIGEGICRVNLGAWKQRHLPLEWLFRMFAGSVEAECRKQEMQEAAAESFQQYEREAKEAVKEGRFSFSYEDFEEYAKNYHQADPHPVHHSEAYRRSEHPAYRLVSTRYLRLLPILQKLAEENLSEKPAVVAIDGRCASGKSTMAQLLSEITEAGVIHMDDFFLPLKLRTEERLAQPGGNVHYERFQEEVLPFLHKKEAFDYRSFDCSKMELGESRRVCESSVRVVEGAYSMHPAFGEYADLKVFSDVEQREQWERIKVRDGEAMLVLFRERWIPMEEHYFAEYAIRDKAAIVV